MMPMAFTTLLNMQLEQCQTVVCKYIAAVHVLRQLRRGFCTIVVLHIISGILESSNLEYEILV